MREYEDGSNFTLVRKKVPMRIALKEVIAQYMNEAAFKWVNPFY